MQDDLYDRVRALLGWELVREERILQKRYRMPNMRAALAFAKFAAAVADAHKLDPEIIPGLSVVQVRIKGKDGRVIAKAEVSLASAIDLNCYPVVR